MNIQQQQQQRRGNSYRDGSVVVHPPASRLPPRMRVDSDSRGDFNLRRHRMFLSEYYKSPSGSCYFIGRAGLVLKKKNEKTNMHV